MNQHINIDELRRKLDKAEFEVSELRRAILASGLPPLFAGLAPAEMKVCVLLRSKTPRWVTRDQLHAYVYADKADAPVSEVIQTHVSKARKKLLPLGIRLESKRNYGYLMAPASAAFWDDALANAERTAP